MVIPLGWNTWDLAVLLLKVLPGLEGWENPSFRAAQVYLSLDPPLHWIVRFPFGPEGCCVQRLRDHPTPTCNPEKGASFLPGCCLSLLSFLSRSRKLCHPGLCCTPPAFLFLTRELPSSSPGQQSPGLQGCTRAVEAGASQGSVRPERTPPFLCAVSSPGGTFQLWVTETLVLDSRDCGAAIPRAKLASS